MLWRIDQLVGSVRKKILLTAIAAHLLLLAGCGPVGPQEASIKVNPEIRYQMITGWEATSQSGEIESRAFPLYKEQLLRSAVNDLGITRVRLEMRSGIENPTDYFTDSGAKSMRSYRSKWYEVINDNDDPFLINPDGFKFAEIDKSIDEVVVPLRELLLERGEQLYINLIVVDFKENDRGSYNLTYSEEPEEYAEFVTAAFLHLHEKYGFVPDAVEVVLEPDTNAAWSGTEVGNAILAAGKRLKERGFYPDFIAPSTKSAGKAPSYIEDIANVPGAMDFVTEFSYHRYRGASENNLKKIADLAKRYGKRTSMLEWIGADADTLIQDLKVANVSAWAQYALAYPNEPDDGGLYYQVDDTGERPVVSLGSRSRLLRQYFRYVRPGAIRIEAQSDNEFFDPVAFENANGGQVLVIRAHAFGKIKIHGLTAGSYNVSAATDSIPEVRESRITIESDAPIELPIGEPGVVTIYSSQGPGSNQ